MYVFYNEMFVRIKLISFSPDIPADTIVARKDNSALNLSLLISCRVHRGLATIRVRSTELMVYQPGPYYHP